MPNISDSVSSVTMEEVENYLKNAKYPEGLSKGEKANFRRKIRNNFKLEDGILFYKHAQERADDATVWKICIRSEKEKDSSDGLLVSVVALQQQSPRILWAALKVSS